MNVVDEINSHRYLYLEALGEPEDNALRIVVTEGRIGGAETGLAGLEGLARLASETRPIVSDAESAAYEIVFDHYIAYAVLNESYSFWDHSETFEGRGFRTYSESKFLSYLRVSSIASDDYPGPFTHYGIVCLNHVIDVASMKPPRIMKM